MKNRLVVLASLLVLVFLLAACAPATDPPKTYPTFTTAESKSAYTAMSTIIGNSMSTSSFPAANITTSANGITAISTDGSVKLVTTTSSTSTRFVITLAKCKDATTGYTISGTMTMDESTTTNMASISADFDLSGPGPIQKITMSASGAMSNSTPANAAVYVNGKKVDISTLQ